MIYAALPTVGLSSASPEVYREVIIPMFAAMTPAPRVHVTRFGAGVHTYTKPEPGLPVGIAPAAAQFYHDAITGGFFRS